ncbi:flagellar motor protein MotB [Oceanimonas baumannii]|uniref:Chemotaxis protein MotB n=1 Tax=Oceanimonas baumannii TaxID=129578 RepID=A0A235CP66_9GAMM|nr:flagellar motor protein MotB [Oceanimonas baumannii]OYD26363.1 flagellar motor protein MotB [Oceanimonas baumannii]TDW61976.1 chemotaxis protein MotB [Oceanimonas baumannii]
MAKKNKPQPAGAPAWMATFADLATILMSFFVLLLAFAEMDVLKFKQIAGSMKYAFGVQNQIEVSDIPKGTSVIALEFRPGQPEPTPINTIMQHTTDSTLAELDFQPGESDRASGQGREDGNMSGSQQPEQTSAEAISLAQAMAEELSSAIEQDAIEIEALGQQVVIRIRENASFPAGSAFLQPKFWPVIRQIGTLVKDVPGEILVSGHSDDIGSGYELFSSNWELSTQRALAVADQLRRTEGFDDSRMVVMGLADTRPLATNDTPEHRRLNRRVEITISQGKPVYTEPVEAVPPNAP